jgi:anaerobic selenocysteine-containing dehydrogenase
MSEDRIRGYCALCISRCGCVSVTRDGVLHSVEPDLEHPTGGGLCLKGMAAPELVYSPDRILHPMIRTRPKNAADPGWTHVSWDKALKVITSQLESIVRASGPEAVSFAVTTPSGTAIADSFGWINRLAHAFGSPNTVFATENCNWHKDFASKHTFGTNIGMPDYERTGCVLLWGFNPTTTWPAQADLLRKARARGARLIVIDPRQTELAGSADQWLRVRPGTDGILALAIAGIMIERNWFERDFIRDFSNGPLLVCSRTGQLLTEADFCVEGSTERFVVWDAAGNHHAFVDAGAALDPSIEPALFGTFPVETPGGVRLCNPAFELYATECGRWPPRLAEAATGIPAEQIIATASLIHESGPVSHFVWTGTAQQREASQIGRAISLLYALTGDLDAPGGNVHFARPPINNVLGFELLGDSQRAKCLGYTERPLGPGCRSWITSRDLFRAVVEEKPYPVKALLSFGSNMLLTKPNTRYAEEALGKLEFYVHADMFLNPAAQFADVILPVASAWERGGLAPGFQISQQAESLVQWREPVIAPRGECRSDTQIVFDLARNLGLSEQFFGADPARGLEHVVEPTGVTVEDLRSHREGISLNLRTEYRKYRQSGFATPSGRLEVYSQSFQENGYSPIPRFELNASPDLYPLLLTTFKCEEFCHSQHRNLPSLRDRRREPMIEIHPQTAEVHGIGDGDLVRVRTDIASMQATARLVPELSPDVVCAQYGWWQPCHELGLTGHKIEGPTNASYNHLIDGEKFDPISSSNALRACPCCIEKA